MRSISWFRAATLGVTICGAAATAYATCCRYLVSWTPNVAVCHASPARVCEDSSVACSGPSTGTDWSCYKNYGIREAECTEYTLGDDGDWGQFPCDMYPGAEWRFVARLANGSCCWVRYDEPPKVTPREALWVAICRAETCVGNGQN
jgi:hypothetical protein